MDLEEEKIMLKSNRRIPLQVDKDFNIKLKDLQAKIQLTNHQHKSLTEITKEIVFSDNWKNVEEELLKRKKGMFRFDKRR